jgi:hypothetical protein
MTQDPNPPYGQHPPWQPPPGGPPAPVYGYGYVPLVPQRPAASGLYVAAAVINWVVLGILVVLTCGVGIVAAAWYIPMTIYIHKGARDRNKHTALGVCTLLFCNLISGILMLVEDSNREPRPGV